MDSWWSRAIYWGRWSIQTCVPELKNQGGIKQKWSFLVETEVTVLPVIGLILKIKFWILLYDSFSYHYNALHEDSMAPICRRGSRGKESLNKPTQLHSKWLCLGGLNPNLCDPHPEPWRLPFDHCYLASVSLQFLSPFPWVWNWTLLLLSAACLVSGSPLWAPYLASHYFLVLTCSLAPPVGFGLSRVAPGSLAQSLRKPGRLRVK